MKVAREELLAQNPSWDFNTPSSRCLLLEMDGPKKNAYGNTFYICTFNVLDENLFLKRRVFTDKLPDLKPGIIGNAFVAIFNNQKFIVLPHENIDVAFRLITNDIVEHLNHSELLGDSSESDKISQTDEVVINDKEKDHIVLIVAILISALLVLAYLVM